MSRLIRRSPVSVMPSRVSPHAAASPTAIVMPKPACTGLTPGIQAMA
jgi:hypothetical protein